MDARVDGRRGPYAKSARVRETAIAAATEVFGIVGYRGGTMKEIARRAGISERGLVHHFPSKMDMLSAVLEHQDSLVAHALTAGSAGPGASYIMKLLELETDRMSRTGVVALRAILLAEATDVDHPAHQRMRAGYQEFREFLETCFSQIARQGLVRVGLPPASLATMFVALMDGTKLQWMYAPQSIDVIGLLREFLEMVCPSILENVTSAAR